jgi:NitT/TauT family transport system ATP-binding protein
MSIVVNNVTQEFNYGLKTKALDNISFSIRESEFLCIIGPSGCGKTTLLKIIAGLITPSRGSIQFTGQNSDNRHPCAMVFQQQGLFPWMTVLENVAFGLEMQKVPQKERIQIATSAINRVGLEGFLHAYPHELSGGMRQRVAILRAFISKPQVLLMDEPFGSLDAQLRALMQEDLLSTWAKDPITIIYITHDIEESILLGDRILVMSGRPGRIAADYQVPFSRPRDFSIRGDPKFLDIYQNIWDIIKNEVYIGERLDQ